MSVIKKIYGRLKTFFTESFGKPATTSFILSGTERNNREEEEDPHKKWYR